MSLREYHRKRHFNKTSEPKGKEKRQRDHHAFVVQKHAASHLHYDFRLEMDGVLKSWAVPKGPSLTPGTKRLAMQVEDHPLEYGSFEGTIPQGEYGGGTVMLWDRGTWEPLDDPHEGMERGRLKFQLQGEKLKGGWMLVRLGGTSGKGDRKPQWLLMKERDDEARSADDPDITEEATLSVKTHRDMDEIEHGNSSVWTSHGEQKKKASPKKVSKPVKKSAKKRSKKTAKKRKPAKFDLDGIAGIRKGKLPETFEPQLATLASQAPEGDQWLHEIKFDGYRLLCRVDRDEVKLFSRSQQDWTRKLPHLVKAAQELGLDQGLFDGEVVALQPDGTSNFQSLQNAFRDGRSGELIYYVFDVLYLNGHDLTAVPLEERKNVLKDLLQRDSETGTVRYSEHVVGGGENFHSEACRLGLEGMISKRRDQPYRSGRGYDWLKVKCQKREEFVIGGFTEPSGSRADFGALLVGYFNGQGQLIYAGKVGTGYTQKTLRDLSQRMRPLEQEASPFENLTRRTGPARTAHWLKPKLVAQVQFSNWTDEEKLRHPSFQGLREDKPAAEVVREAAVPIKKIEHADSSKEDSTMKTKTKSKPGKTTKSRAGSKVSSGSANREEATVAGVRLTHPDKVLYADDGITKLQLAEYYEAVAEWMLPHVVNRPTVLVRCPEGQKKECFYQKHLDTDPTGTLRLVPITEKSSTRNYAVVDDVAGLIALSQMGVLEVHVWGSQVDKIERPDRLIFDLDPDPSVEWSTVVASARQIREFLSDLGLETFVKTTGGKGVHLVAPIQRRHDWDEVREFCEDVARAIVRADPEHYTANMSKKARPGKIFIDYLRNARGATAVAPYSTRARAGAPVSMPLDWKELSAKVPANYFTLQNAPDRLRSRKRDPWAEMDSVKQTISAAAKKQVKD